MTDQLADKLPCPGILFWESCVVCNVLQQRRSLEGCPQHKEVCKVQILHPFPHPCMPGTLASADALQPSLPYGKPASLLTKNMQTVHPSRYLMAFAG